MKHKQFLLFDLDGTVIDSSPGIFNCVTHTLNVFSRPIPPMEELSRFIGPPLLESFMKIAEMDEEEANRAVAKYREKYSAGGLFDCRLYEGIKETVSTLKAGGKTIILATAKPTVFANRILEHLEISSLFDLVVGSELDGRFSYKLEIIEEVLRSPLSPKKELTVMIGDRDQDIKGAHLAGISSVGVRYGFANPDELEAAGAEKIVSTPRELLNIFI